MASLKDIPVIGGALYDARQALHGNPDEIKAAYDTQIQASKDAQERMMNFLMAQKGQAQSFYGPISRMFQSSYGTQGLQAPQVPQATAGMGPIQRMYGGG